MKGASRPIATMRFARAPWRTPKVVIARSSRVFVASTASYRREGRDDREDA
jgi:hypothetical protein